MGDFSYNTKSYQVQPHTTKKTALRVVVVAKTQKEEKIFIYKLLLANFDG